MIFYGLLVIFFAYFYTAIAFNPVDTADNLRKFVKMGARVRKLLGA
jgi:preprotein translocase subunit SecY